MGWSLASGSLVDAGSALYRTRGAALVARTSTWPPPGRRHVVVATDATAVRPYAPLLGGAARLLYASDLDPERSHPELIAWLLALGDWMAATGEAAMAATRAGAWWLDRSDEECAAFAQAARASTRPDAAGLRATVDSLAWLRGLHHDDLRPAPRGSRARAIPGTGLVVPAEHDAGPPALVAAWERAATDALAGYRRRWGHRSGDARARLLAWLRELAPPVLLAAGRGRLVWDPAHPEAVGALRHTLADCDDVAVEAAGRDVERIAAVARAFDRAIVDPDSRPTAAGDELESRGYVHLHPTRPTLVYDLDEPGMERRLGPPLPFEPEMVAARAAHELGHLADRAGWIVGDPPTEAIATLAAALDEVIAAAAPAIATATAADVAALGGPGRAGAALVQLLLTRAADWRANLVLARLATPSERAVYAWHNVRRLTREYAPRTCWRLLVRYLYEYQYLGPALGLVAPADPWATFDGVTNAERDLVAPGVLTRDAFETLAVRAAALFAPYRIDPARLAFG